MLVLRIAFAMVALPPLKLDRLKPEFSANIPWLGEELKTMKAPRFTEAQKAFILRQCQEGTPVARDLPKGGHQSGDLLQLE